MQLKELHLPTLAKERLINRCDRHRKSTIELCKVNVRAHSATTAGKEIN
jgi:hypothetical protein